MRLSKIKNLNFIFIIFFIFAFLVCNRTYANSTTAQQLGFPYSINFSDSEINFLKKLDPATLQKLIQVANLLLKNQNTAANTLANSITASSSKLTSNTNPNTPPTAPQSSYLPFTAKSPETQSFGSNGYTAADYNQAAQAAQAYQGQIGAPIDPRQVDLSKLPADTTNNCKPTLGVQGNIGNVSGKLKFDMTCLCIAFGGQKIKNEGTTRSGTCRSGDQHSCGRAIDISTNQYSDKAKNAMLIVNLIAMGYNIGSYQSGFTSYHADHQPISEDTRWKTWSGVAHTNYAGGNQRPYIEEVRDALLIIGKPANSSAEFRSKYGNFPKSEMMKLAAQAVNEKGNDMMKSCIKDTLTP